MNRNRPPDHDPDERMDRTWEASEPLLAAERRRFAAEEAEVAADAPVFAARILARAREGQRAAPAGWRFFSLSRLLAVSVCGHALALLALALWAGGAQPAAKPTAPTPPVEMVFEPAADDGGEDAESYLALASWLKRAATLPGALDARSDEVLAGRLALAPRDEDPGVLFADPFAGLVERLGPLDAAPPFFDHPAGVALPMLVRRFPALRERRLALLGMDGARVRAQVQRQLALLGERQAADGSFVPPAGDLSLERATALAALPFLAEGAGAPRTTREIDDRARRAVEWLRDRLFDEEGRLLESSAAADATGPAALALCEMYMLSFGGLGPVEARERRGEIVALISDLRTRASVAQPESVVDLWAVDAAARAGLVETTSEETRTLAAWRAGASTAPLAGGGAAAVFEAATARILTAFAEAGSARSSDPERAARLTDLGTTLLRALEALPEPPAFGDVEPTVQPPPSADPEGSAWAQRVYTILAWQSAYRTY